MSAPTLKALRALLIAGDEPLNGTAIMRREGLKAGTLFPMLKRLEAAGWVTGEWEAEDPKVLGRPRQKFYRLTDLGRERATAELKALQLGE
jgi:DNA-binding PadR family transcriptional regulator